MTTPIGISFRYGSESPTPVAGALGMRTHREKKRAKARTTNSGAALKETG